MPPNFTGLSSQAGHRVTGQPYPTDISITSTPAFRADIYGEDEIIQVSVKFDQNVTVIGTANIILFIGAENDERPELFYASPTSYVSGQRRRHVGLRIQGAGFRQRCQWR